jgi:predicted metal-binding membrane protein
VAWARLPIRSRWPERQAIPGHLIVLILWIAAGASWLWLIAANHVMPGAPGADVTMGLSCAGFLGFWTVMMVAMMFPAAAPMVRTYYAISRRRATAVPGMATALFLLGYLMLWILTGLAAYGVAVVCTTALTHYNLTSSAIGRLGGIIIAAAGLYQLTSIKRFCLSKCASPISFIMTSWRAGTAGALTMGWGHGLYCLGCCWMLFVFLFPLGMMNIASMAAVTVLIFAEKVFSFRHEFSRVAGVMLVAFGVTVIVQPTLLPVAGQMTKPMKAQPMKMSM